MNVYTPVAKLSDIPAGRSKAVNVGGKDIALFNVDGRVYAIDNLCCHRGAPLVDGDLSGEIVTCPWHAWQFNVASGHCTTVPAARQNAYPVQIEGEDITVQI
jgi:nitrite reductase (NADH) small subunit